MEWIFLIIVFVSIVIYNIIDRYFEYKENVEKTKNDYRNKKCNKFVNYKTMKCPNSSKCYNTLDKPYFRELKERINI